jgi:Ca2+-binding EF-hand superfamily protein
MAEWFGLFDRNSDGEVTFFELRDRLLNDMASQQSSG